MSDVNARIGIEIDTSNALAELKSLQRQLAVFHSSMAKGSAAAASAQKNLQQNLVNQINASGKFVAQMGMIRTSTESFTNSLEKNKFSMREYFRYAGGATRTFGRLFKSEFDTIGKVAEDRVKQLQTQYIKMGRDATGAMKAISVTPTSLNMKDFGTQAALAAQKQALFNQLVKQGSTNLLNFGKNTQWAGRQLMVGFTVPLTLFGTKAAQVFMELEAQSIRFKRVYGDIFTTTEETNKAIKEIELLAKSFTKYGVAVTDTMKMAADAAAMGKTGAELTAQVAEATRLAVLGGVEQAQALETTTSLTNAFGIAAEDLASKINFLNAVENQTVTSIEDLTIAIPKAGPVVKQLGGDVEDLAFFLTAMKEGGINASEGANALKSGLASLINPTEKASAMLADMGINIKQIVEGNAGNLKTTVVEFARALDTLAPLDRARAVEQLFGKFQFARLSTLFQNITQEGTQANRVLGLTNSSVEELAILSEREMKKVEDAVGTNFKAAIEDLKVSIAPIGKTFLEAVTPIIKFAGELLDKFNNLGDGTKKFLVVATTVAGVVGPALLMTFGLLANGAANIIKLFMLMRQGFLRLSGGSKILAEQTTYMTQEQLDSATVAASLNQAHSQLTQQFVLEKSALVALRQAYIDATLAAGQFMLNNPGMMAPGRGGKPPKKYAKGVQYVPGTGDKDTVAAMLTPGEAVIPKDIAQNPAVRPLLEALISGDIKKYKFGTPFAGEDYTHIGGSSSRSISDIVQLANLSPADKAKLEAYSAILEANGGAGNVSVRHNAAFSFPSELNRRMAKGGVEFDIFKEAWLRHRAEKWRVSGLDPSEASLLDDTMLSLIEKKAKANRGIVTDTLVEQSFLDLPPSVTDGPAYSKLKQRYDTLGEYTLGKGLSDKPDVMAAKIRKTIASKGLKDLPVIFIDGDEVLPNGDTVTKAIERGQYKLPKDSHVIVTRSNSKGKRVNSGIYVVDNSGNQLAMGRGSSGQRNTIGQRQSAKASSRTVAVAKGETVVDKKGRTKKVDGQTGTPRPASVRTRRPSLRDTRLIRLPYTSSVVPNAEDGMVGVDPQTGKPVSSVAKGFRFGGGFWARQGKKQSSVQEELIQAQEDLIDETTEYTDGTKTAKDKLRAFSSKASLAAGSISGIAVAASFAGGKIGEIAQSVMPFIFALQGITMVLPLLANPWVAAVAAIALVGGVMLKMAQDVENARKEGVNLAKAMSMTSKKLTDLSVITGTVSATEAANRRRQNIISGTNEAQRQFGQNALESDVGKQILADIEMQSKNGMSVKEISQNLANNLAVAVAQGAVTTKQARSIASALGEKLGSYEIPALVSGKLVSLLGPNGENLANDPLQITLEIQRQSMQRQADSFKTAIEQSTSTTTFVNVGQVIGGGILAAAGGLLALGAGWTGAGAVAGVAATAAGASAVSAGLSDQNKRREVNTKLAAAAVELGVQEVAQNQGLVDSLNRQYDIKLKSAKTEAEIKTIQDQRKAGLAQLNSTNASALALLVKQKDELGEGAFNKGIKAAADVMYKEGPMAVFKDQALEELDKLKNSEFKTQLQIGLASGQVNPMTLGKILSMASENKGFETSFKLLVEKQGLADASMIADLLPKEGATGKTRSLILNYINNNEKDFETDLNALKALTQMSPTYGVTLDLKTNGVQQLVTATTALEAIKNQPEQLNFKLVQELAGQNPAVFSGVLENWTQLSQGKDLINKNLVVNYLVGSADPSLQAAAKAAGLTVAEYIAKGFVAPTPLDNKPPVDPTQKKERDTTLDGILTSLKRTRNAAINATGGIKELLRVAGGKKEINIFKGMDQQLAIKGNTQEFIDFLGGLDKKQLAVFVNSKKLSKGIVELTSKGKALKKAYDAKALGDFSTQTIIATEEVKAQRNSFAKLTAAGLPAAQAIEMLGNAQFAMALKTQKNPEVIKKLINQFKELTKQTKLTEEALKTPTDKLRDRIDPIQEQIDMETNLLDLQERGIRLDYEPKIQALQDQVSANEELIESNQRLLEINYDRPIQALQDQAAKYNRELDGIDKNAESINKKYDAQEEALNKVKQINSDIADQQKRQLDLAGALSQGDISAAAQAIQNIRAANAARAADRSMAGLSAARKFELDALKGPSGLTRLQIQDKLYKIDQDIYKLEQDKIPTLKEITRLQDENYKLSVSQEGSIQKLQKEMDGKIAKIEAARLKWVAIQIDVDKASANIKAIDTPLLGNEEILKRIKKLWEDIAELSGAKPKTTTTGESDPGGSDNTGNTDNKDNNTGGSKKTDNNTGGSNNNTGNDTGKTSSSNFTYSPPIPTSTTKASIGSTAVSLFGTGSLLGSAVNAIKTTVGKKLTTAATAVKSTAVKVANVVKEAVSNPVATIKSVANTVATKTKSLLGKVFGGFGFASGGLVPNVGSQLFPSMGTDTVPSMLTPGEFVMNRASTQRYAPMLNAMNNGSFPSLIGNTLKSVASSQIKQPPRQPSVSQNITRPPVQIPPMAPGLGKRNMEPPKLPNFSASKYDTASRPIPHVSKPTTKTVNNTSNPVYNYSLSINANGSNANANDIARSVMTQIKSLEGQRVRRQK